VAFAYTAISFAGILKAKQSPPDGSEMGNLLLNFLGFCIDLANDIHAELVRVAAEREELLDFRERETELLSAPDEAKTAHSVQRVSPVARRFPRRWWHEPLALVVADRFEIYTAAFGKLANCKRLHTNRYYYSKTRT
jgi:hypothetical protein